MVNNHILFDSSVPEQAPTFLKGYPLNSSAIHISWKSIPPSSHKDLLLGYRIIYRRRGSRLYKEINVPRDVTETVIADLVSETTYEIAVNGFNENGGGPSSEMLAVGTLAVGKFPGPKPYQSFNEDTFYLEYQHQVCRQQTLKDNEDE